MFLVNLLWYHVSPGMRRDGFPSWTLAGWIGGKLSGEMFVNNLKAPSKMHWKTKVWVEGVVREDVTLFEDMPQGLSTYSMIRYIHIQARTLGCELVLLGEEDVPQGDASPGLYAKMELDDKTTGYVRIFPSDTPSPHPPYNYDPGQEESCRAIILPFALAAMPSNTYFDVVDGMASVLVVRDMGDWWERVGVGFVCTRVLGFEGEVVGEVAFFGVREGEDEKDCGDGNSEAESTEEEKGRERNGKEFVELRKGWIGMKKFLELGKGRQEVDGDEGEGDGDGDGSEGWDEVDIRDSGHGEKKFVELGKGWMEDVKWDVMMIRMG